MRRGSTPAPNGGCRGVPARCHGALAWPGGCNVVGGCTAVGLIGMAAVGAAVRVRGTRRLRLAVAAETGPELSEAFRAISSSPALAASVRLRIAIGIGILGLMTVKPADVATSCLVLAASVLAGLVAGVVPVAARFPRRARPTIS